MGLVARGGPMVMGILAIFVFAGQGARKRQPKDESPGDGAVGGNSDHGFTFPSIRSRAMRVLRAACA